MKTTISLAFLCVGLATLFQTGQSSTEISECYQQPARAKCQPGTVVEERFTFDSESGECKPYNYGCGPTTNIYKTIEECIEKCQAPIVSDTMEDFKYSYFSEVSDNSASADDWSNELPQEEEVKVQDEKTDKEKGAKAICGLPSDSGMCLAYIPRFYYNCNTGKCEQFVYGGCGGNKNNFHTEAECLEACAGYSCKAELK